MVRRLLDRTRPYGTVTGIAGEGDLAGARYEQDGRLYDALGVCLSDEAEAPTGEPPAIAELSVAEFRVLKDNAPVDLLERWMREEQARPTPRVSILREAAAEIAQRSGP